MRLTIKRFNYLYTVFSNDIYELSNVCFSHKFGDEGSIRLLVITLLIVLGVIYHYVKKLYGVFIYTKYMKPIMREIHPYKRTILL